MGLFNNANNSGSLTPSGIGSGPTHAQQQLFANAAQDSGLASMGMGMVDQMTNGNAMENEDQVKLLYQLMAAHPNQVALFFHDHASFLPELVNMIGLVVRKEMFAVLTSGVFDAGLRPDNAAPSYGTYSSITQENIDAQLAKVLPPQEIQAVIQQGDMQAMHLMNGHNQQMMMGQQQTQQQQWQQQQMMQQQMMQQQMPQRGIGSAVAGFGSSLIRGSLGLPPAQQQAMGQQPMGQQPMQGYPRQY